MVTEVGHQTEFVKSYGLLRAVFLGTRATHACLLDGRHQNAINRSAVTGGEHRLCQTGLWPCRKCEVELHLAEAAI